MKYLPMLLVTIALTGCSTLPPAIENPPAYDLSYAQASAETGHYRGAPVRWGGVIIDVFNEKTFSRIQVMAYPLNSYGRPERDEEPQGRFYIYDDKFLDPAVYEKDKDITAAGILEGDEELMVGNKPLKLPKVRATTLYLWPEYYRRPYYYDGGFGGWGGWGYPYSGFYGYPYFWGGYYGFYPPY